MPYVRTKQNRELARIRKTTHGMSHTRPFVTWVNMRNRCENPKNKNFENYGGKGIRVCERWQKFENFWDDMKRGYSDNLTLDRIDNNGNYEPNNCRWATMKEQGRNTNRNHLISYAGITKTITEWSEITGIKQTTIRMRLSNYGWTVEDSLKKGGHYSF